MSAELIALAVERSVFQPRHQFAQLAADHVPFDSLTSSSRFESKALRSILAGGTVGVLGPRGGGKSSLIAHICGGLPGTHTALRVPVSGADDPTSVNVMGAVALGQALNDLEMEERHRREIEAARADGRVVEEDAGKVGGTLGGGAIPAAVHAELGSLREELRTESQAIDRLAGLERLIGILRSQELRPVFVLEELDTAFLIAVQNVFAST